MKKIIPILMLAALCCGVISCNEKPAKEQNTESEDVELISYKFVQVMDDGSQISDKIEAKNDTDALTKFIDRMTKVVVEEATAGDSKVKTESMYVISSKGDTLNTNEELMSVIEKQVANQQPVQLAVPVNKKK